MSAKGSRNLELTLAATHLTLRLIRRPKERLKTDMCSRKKHYRFFVEPCGPDEATYMYAESVAWALANKLDPKRLYYLEAAGGIIPQDLIDWLLISEGCKDDGSKPSTKSGPK